MARGAFGLVTVCLLLITDGRLDYFARAMRSASTFLPSFDQQIIIDDTDHSLGFAAAIQKGWAQVKSDWVFHLEDDFEFRDMVPVGEMIGVLRRHPYLAQMALKRQAWNAEEKEAGGIVELRPGEFKERWDGEALWTEHRLFFTTNPSVYSSKLCLLGWPQESESEGKFTHKLLEYPELRFAFWGGKFAPPMVQHFGDRTGHGY